MDPDLTISTGPGNDGYEDDLDQVRALITGQASTVVIQSRTAAASDVMDIAVELGRGYTSERLGGGWVKATIT